MIRGDMPDMTVDELLENDEDDDYSLNEEEVKEAVEEADEMGSTMEVMAALILLHRLFVDGYITAAELEDRADELIEYAKDHDIKLP
jgi:hypothetical protein